ncbi:MAG: WYL domain-containing protein [Deltaproteobacteria bacterium]|nr:WYL domain-containing protein [Deltaproteobacteria bacterium]
MLWFIFLPYNLIRFLLWLIFGRRKLIEKDKHVLKWLEKPDDPMRPQDYKVKRIAEINDLIKIGKSVYLKYAGTDGLTFRRVVPERLFRRGKNIYMDAFCLKEKDMRVFRLDRIKHLE